MSAYKLSLHANKRNELLHRQKEMNEFSWRTDSPVYNASSLQGQIYKPIK